MNNTLTPNEISKPNKDTLISYYPRLTDITSTQISFNSVFELIKTGNGIKSIIRRLRNEPDKAKRDQLKKTLPAITVSGLFGESRKAENLLLHSGFIQLDFDGVKDIELSLQRLKNDKFAFAVFLSPSGNGIKLIIKISPNKDTHVTYFNQLKKYYFQNFQLTVDKQCKDVTRLMFLSWDNDLFVNENSNIWEEIENAEIEKFEKTLSDLQSKESFIIGKRNDFVYKLACDCCTRGIEISHTISEINKRFSSEDFNSIEIDKTVKSAYNSKKKQKESIENTGNSYSALKRAENYLDSKYQIRLNEVSSKIEIKSKNVDEPYRELNENNIFRELQHNNIPLGIQKITSLLQSDFVPMYNPFYDYFESLPQWLPNEEKDYINDLCEYIPVTDMERFKLHFKKMLVRSIACALEPGIFNKQVFVLVGEAQNTGKSTFLRWLCPPALKDYITEYVNTDKDGLIVLATNFFINMDELAALSRAEINSLKSFISKDKINVRLPFAKRTSVHPRRANFIGSTNNDQFLTDETGSVRWLCFEIIGMINFAYKDDIEINDVWRQAYTLYKQGFVYELTVNEIKEMHTINSRFLVQSMDVQLINKYYSPATKQDGKFVDATEVYNFIATRHVHFKSNIRSIGKAMIILGFKKETKYNSERGFSIYGYFVNEILEK